MRSSRALRTVFMGTPEFAVPSLEALLAAEVDLRGVYTQPDRPAGRGRKMQQSPVKQVAEEAGVPVFQPQKLRAEGVVEELRKLHPELIVVAAYGQILPKAVLELPKCGCINVHASLLPRHRGAAPIQKAILDGDTVSGITTMLMDEGLDTGDMLVKRSLPIGADETAGELHDRLARLGRDVLEETLARFCAGTLHPQPQDDSQSTYAPMLKKEDGLIHWQQPALEVHNRIRGLDPWPGAFTYWQGETLKLFCSRLDRHCSGSPGQVLAASAEGIQVACGEGAVRILELQRAGYKRLPVADFLRGAELPPGDWLAS